MRRGDIEPRIEPREGNNRAERGYGDEPHSGAAEVIVVCGGGNAPNNGVVL